MKIRKPALHIQRATKRERALYHTASEWPTLLEILSFIATCAVVTSIVGALLNALV